MYPLGKGSSWTDKVGRSTWMET